MLNAANDQLREQAAPRGIDLGLRAASSRAPVNASGKRAAGAGAFGDCQFVSAR